MWWGCTFDDGFDLRAFGFGDEGLLWHDFGDELVDVCVFGEVEEVDALGLDFSVAAGVLEGDAGRVVPDQYLFEFHGNNTI